MKDRIIAMGDTLDPNSVLRRLASRVVSWVFTEGTFRFEGLRVGRNESLQDDLRGRRNQQVTCLAFDQLYRRASKRSRQFVFRMIHRRGRRHEQRLVPTDNHSHGHLLTAILVFAEVLAPALRHRQQNTDGVFLGDHAAVSPGVENTRVGISGNDTRGGHDKTATVVGIPLWDRELEQIHRVALDDILFNGTAAHDEGFNRF